MVNALQPTVSPAQVRAARAWLNWSQDQLSARSGISKRTIARYESGKTLAHPETIDLIRDVLEGEGIVFQFVGMVPKGIGVS
ncbi:MAG: helix-turn-helix transcriptional regulator [Rhizobiales bacterium]|nr:helix-turn-helix transcriptional regulator [Hyphomicrobiales bacterium]